MAQTLTPDLFFQEFVGEFLAGRLPKEKYFEIETFFLRNNPNRIDIENLRRRLDSRTIAEFAEGLLAHTKKERFLVSLFADQMKKMGKTVRIKDNGVDNLGGFIGRAHEGIPKADFLITIQGEAERPYEVKNSPSRHKVTFKVVNLEEYLAEGAWILLFYGTGRLENNHLAIDKVNTRWTVLRTHQIKALLELPQKFFWEIGNKRGVQILSGEFANFWQEYKLY